MPSAQPPPLLQLVAGAAVGSALAGCGGLVIFEETGPAEEPGLGGGGAGSTATTGSGPVSSSGPGGGGDTSGGGGGDGGEAPTCTPVRQACQSFCDTCAPGPGRGCTDDCLAFHVAASPRCDAPYLAEIVCMAAAAQGEPGCEGALGACQDEVDAFFACVEENPSCNGYACQGCNCHADCGGGMRVDCDAEGDVCTCVVDGVLLGECREVCGVDAMACCADLAAGPCR